MKFFTKAVIVSMAITGMVHADTMLIGVDAGLTIGGARLGVVVGVTGGHARSYTAPGHHAHGHSGHSGHSCGTVVAAVVHNPCDYVCGPCEVIAPPVVCDPCAR